MNERIPKRWQGLHPHRLTTKADNPLERRFARAWHHINTDCERDGPGRRSVLAELLGSETTSDDDRQVACTVVQWLGSAVGESWVRSVLREHGLTPAETALLEELRDGLTPGKRKAMVPRERQAARGGRRAHPASRMDG